ncbi:MAG: hemerythrin domain-containing protein [Nocardioidaceae bacterium]|nr:hemerythrin domain-containing protein [Nocardioidaceae bacterium]
MGSAVEDREKAARLPEGDVIRILLEQHARIRDLFDDVKESEGEHKGQAFDELRALLAVHETAEEMVLRPVSKEVAGESVVDERNHEENEANHVLQQLESMDVDSPDFDAQLEMFEQAVDRHAEAEENEEFPAIVESCDEERRAAMGKRLRTVEGLAPTHPHPSTAGSTAAQWTVGPFASIIDRARDALSHS